MFGVAITNVLTVLRCVECEVSALVTIARPAVGILDVGLKEMLSYALCKCDASFP